MPGGISEPAGEWNSGRGEFFFLVVWQSIYFVVVCESCESDVFSIYPECYDKRPDLHSSIAMQGSSEGFVDFRVLDYLEYFLVYPFL